MNLAPFAQLPDNATIRIIPIAGTLAPGDRSALIAVLQALLDQWKERGVIITSAFAEHTSGSFLIMAWNPAREELSGCTKDQLTHTVLEFEQRLGVPMVNAPRFVVELDTGTTFLTMREFKQLRAAGRIIPATHAYDHLITTVGDLRAGRFETTIADSWYSPVGA